MDMPFKKATFTCKNRHTVLKYCKSDADIRRVFQAHTCDVCKFPFEICEIKDETIMAVRDIDALESNIQKIQKELNDAQATLKSLKEQEEKDSGYFVPRGRTCGFHYVLGNGEVCSSQSPNDYFQYIRMGLYAKTRKEAEKIVARMQVTQKLRVLANGFKPDWNNNLTYKYYIYMYEKNFQIGCYASTSLGPGVVYFKTDTEAMNAIKELGDELYVLFDD